MSDGTTAGATDQRLALGRPHVFVVAGDVTRIECDAWLLPTDVGFSISHESFRAALKLPLSGPQNLTGYRWDGHMITRWERPEEDHGPEIWLGRVGEADGDWSEKLATLATEFVARASREVGAPTGRYPLLALPVIGTGRGGAADHKGEVYLALLSALTEVAEACGADVILVTKTAKGYSAAQRARSHLLAQRHGGNVLELWDLGEKGANLNAAAGRLAGHLQAGRLVQFVGAGASAGICERTGIPAWQSLLDEVAKKLADPQFSPNALRRLDLRDQATVLADSLRKKGSSLGEELKKAVSRSHYTLAHGLLASLGTLQNVTTNFDTMLETALRAAYGEDLAVLPYTAVEGKRRWVLKLHGSVDQGTDDGGDTFVITRDDYLSMPARYGALYGLVQALLLTQHMLFVGYSLSDEDFHQVVHEVRAARGGRDEPAMGTVLSLFEPPSFKVLWRDLEIVAMSDLPPVEDKDDPAVTVAARRLLVFCDLVGHHAANLYRFLLDSGYEAMLPPGDEQDPGAHSDQMLRAALGVLKKRAKGHDGPGWAPVRQLLADYGADN